MTFYAAFQSSRTLIATATCGNNFSLEKKEEKSPSNLLPTYQLNAEGSEMLTVMKKTCGLYINTQYYLY